MEQDTISFEDMQKALAASGYDKQTIDKIIKNMIEWEVEQKKMRARATHWQENLIREYISLILKNHL